jgi:hypothetical protein
MYDFITDLDGYFCETYANYDKLCILPGYVMPVMQRSEVREDGRTYAYTLPAETMRLANQEKKEEILRELKSRLTDITFSFSFRPVGKDPIHIYHISDAHNMIKSTVAAGRYFGESLDLLVLNGDIPNHSGKIEYFDTVYAIVSELTHGMIPTVFSRGNHDLRGIHAEDFADYTPADLDRAIEEYSRRNRRFGGV